MVTQMWTVDCGLTSDGDGGHIGRRTVAAGDSVS